MADLTVTATKVAPVYPSKAEIYPMIATEAITAGQVVYVLSTGKVGVADANAAGKQQARGIALESVPAGAAVSVLKRGHVSGYTISQNGDTRLFLSDTAGAIADAAGTMSVPLGRVVSLSDSALTKVAYVDLNWSDQFA